MAEKDKRYYWLKLKRDFFKRHDIQIIESMPNGKDYVLFYLKLLCESVDHDGNLRFSEQIPYNEQMLSTITNTNIDIVRSAIKVFTELQMMELLDDGTFFMNEVQKMIGSAADNDNANRQRRYRERQKQLALQENLDIVTESNESKIKSIDKELDIDTDIEKDKDTELEEKKNTPKKKPKEEKHKYGEYRHVLLTDKQFEKLVNDYGEFEVQSAIKFLDEYIQMKGYKAKDHNLALRKWVFKAVEEEKGKNNPQQSRGNDYWAGI